jgi:CheY-like chemotaxis protein
VCRDRSQICDTAVLSSVFPLKSRLKYPIRAAVGIGVVHFPTSLIVTLTQKRQSRESGADELRIMAKKTFTDHSFSRQVAALNKKAVAQSKVVSLKDYREVTTGNASKTILVVDDELVMRNAIKRIFEKEKYKVLVAKDAMELSKIIEDTKLDLILLDINLPWVDGYELCSLLKAHPVLKHLPVAFVSGNKTEEDIKRGFEAGCDEYITKPFEVDEIQNTVNQLLLKSGA